MANGTIAFDTLTTSDQVNTGTEKSIDTSYIFNGVSKAWVEYDGTASGATIGDSFNVSSTDDDATGDYGVNFTNAMGNTKYTCTFGDGEGTSSSGLRFLSDAGSTTSSQELYARNVSNSAQDVDAASVVIHGDLA